VLGITSWFLGEHFDLRHEDGTKESGTVLDGDDRECVHCSDQEGGKELGIGVGVVPKAFV